MKHRAFKNSVPSSHFMAKVAKIRPQACSEHQSILSLYLSGEKLFLQNCGCFKSAKKCYPQIANPQNLKNWLRKHSANPRFLDDCNIVHTSSSQANFLPMQCRKICEFPFATSSYRYGKSLCFIISANLQHSSILIDLSLLTYSWWKSSSRIIPRRPYFLFKES